MLYNNGYIGGQIVPMIETNNILTNPTGPDCQFLVGEGKPGRAGSSVSSSPAIANRFIPQVYTSLRKTFSWPRLHRTLPKPP